MNDESAPKDASLAATANVESTPAACIFPRQRPAAPSEFRRLRRARAECVAASRRDVDIDTRTTPSPANTYGLSEDELRNHGNELHRLGWSVDEIESTLAVERAAK